MKRIAALLCLMTLILAGSSCARSARFGVFELERRLCEYDKANAFGTEGVFRREGVYHIFYRTEKGTLLLKAAEDEKQRICYLSLTTTDTDADTAERFSALSRALVNVSLPEDVRAEAAAALGLDDPSDFFSDETINAVYGRYQTVFFKTARGISLMLKYE